MIFWLVPAAFALDLVLGDPHSLPHPVVWIGRLIRRLEAAMEERPKNRRLAGAILAAATLAVVFASAWGGLALAGRLGEVVEGALALWLAYTTLALRSLHSESRAVVTLVEEGRLDEARLALSFIVSRDTAALDREGILRACIETVAENTSDGVVAPLCYLFAGGPVGALLYKGASTLDSMVGYRNERYRDFGWASARLDDILNLVPARLTALFMALAALLLRLDGGRALRTVRRDARKHHSPNAGFPEAAVAGALGIRLGGPAVYFGTPVDKSALGDDLAPVTPEHYRQTVALMYLSSFLTLAGGVLLTLWLRHNPCI